MPSNKHGTDFEKQVQAHLKFLQQKHPLIFHRFQDTKAARVNFLPAQPGDFMAFSHPNLFLLECKASLEHASLRSCFSGMVDGGQIGHMKLWQRAGAETYILFKNVPADHYEIWPGSTAVEARTLGRPLQPDACAIKESKAEFLKALTTLLT